MAIRGGLGQAFFFGGYDVSGDVGSIDTMSQPRTFMEIPAVNIVGTRRLGLLSSAQLGYSFWFNDATDAMHEAIKTAPTGDEHAMLAFNATPSTSVQIGDIAICVRGKRTNTGFSRSADGSFSGTVNIDGSGEGAMMVGHMLTTGNQLFASAADNASYDQWDTATAESLLFGIEICHQFFDAPDSGSPTAIIEDSSDDSAWATLLSLGVISARATGRNTVTGNVDRYIRLSVTGTFTNQRIAIAVLRHNNANYVEDLS